MTPLGIYVHFPFCLRKCHYCDFNSRVGSAAERGAYLRALLTEIAQWGAAAACVQPAATVYFGGGTPTLYAADELSAALDALCQVFELAPGAEITCEANPGTVSAPSLLALRRCGFNRLSLGVQSMDDGELALLGRVHTAEDASRAVADARGAGFRNVSVDLIRGLPGQRLRAWDATLAATIALAPEHISVYGLSLEYGTPLHDGVCRGVLPPPRGNASPHWVRWTVRRLAQAGYGRYEISNYARPGCECRHSLNYWHNGEYVGFGAGAWSYLGGERRRNLTDPSAYAAAVEAGHALTEQSERLGPEQRLGETIMLALRMAEGMDLEAARRRFGVDIRERHGSVVSALVAAQLAVIEGGFLRLTPAGLMVQSAVAAQFLP